MLQRYLRHRIVIYQGAVEYWIFGRRNLGSLLCICAVPVFDFDDEVRSEGGNICSDGAILVISLGPPLLTKLNNRINFHFFQSWDEGLLVVVATIVTVVPNPEYMQKTIRC